jgi:hypothetical protein
LHDVITIVRLTNKIADILYMFFIIEKF